MKKGFRYLLYVCFSPIGRINRAGWWLSWVFLLLYQILGAALHAGIPADGVILDIFLFASLLIRVGLVYAIIVATAKRLHDTKRSGWNGLWVLIPTFGVFYILIVCGFFKGTYRENKYGEPIDYKSFSNDTN